MYVMLVINITRTILTCAPTRERADSTVFFANGKIQPGGALQIVLDLFGYQFHT